jgi:hypothetical protein
MLISQKRGFGRVFCLSRCLLWSEAVGTGRGDVAKRSASEPRPVPAASGPTLTVDELKTPQMFSQGKLG